MSQTAFKNPNSPPAAVLAIIIQTKWPLEKLDLSPFSL
jgi:hypothetical protein